MVKIQQMMSSLRPSDVITKHKLSRESNLDIDTAESLLIDLFNEGILQVVIVVECSNEEYSHHILLYSFDEYYNYERDGKCPECGAALEFKKAKVGFRKGHEAIVV